MVVRRLWLWAVLPLALAWESPSAAEPGAGLYLGEIRFHAAQQDYFSALVDLLNAIAAGRVDAANPQAQALLGRLQLGFGLYGDARQSLDQVLETSASPPLHGQVWLTIARDAIQRQRFEQGLQALDQVPAATGSDTAREVLRLRALTEIRRGRFARGADLLQQLLRSADDPLLRFNLAVAQLRMGRHAPAEELLRGLLKRESSDERALSLADHAAYRLGLSLGARGLSREALTPLEQVRLHGLHGTRALLATGLMLEQTGEVERALVPWKVLRQRSVLDPAVQEAWIRIAKTLYQQGQHRDASFELLDAKDAFERALRQLGNARQSVQDGRLMGALRGLGDQALRESAWMGRLLARVPEVRPLGGVFADARFQRELRVHQDLARLSRNLAAWQSDLSAFGSMLDQHEKLFARLSPWMDEKLAAMETGGLESRIGDMRARVDGLAASGESAALTSAAEQAWLEHLRKLETHLADLPAAERSPLAERIRLLRARVVWHREADFPQRLQRLREGLAEAGSEAGAARREIDYIRKAGREVPATIERRRQRLAALGRRLAELQPRLEAVLVQQEQLLAGLLGAEIDHIEAGLRQRMLDARMLLARNYDDAQRQAAEAVQ